MTSKNILGVNNRSYPNEYGLGDTIITTVAVLGIDQKVRVYTGHGSPEWIADWGNKLPYEEAVRQFPTLKKEECAW